MSVTKNATEWVLYAHLAQPVSCVAVRLVIKDINNGRWFEDKQPLPNGIDTATGVNSVFYASPLRAMLYELEAYGASGQ